MVVVAAAAAAAGAEQVQNTVKQINADDESKQMIQSESHAKDQKAVRCKVLQVTEQGKTDQKTEHYNTDQASARSRFRRT